MALVKIFGLVWTGIWHSSVRFGLFAKVSIGFCPTLKNWVWLKLVIILFTLLVCPSRIHHNWLGPVLLGSSPISYLQATIQGMMSAARCFMVMKDWILISWLSLHLCLAQGRVWYVNIISHISYENLMNPDLWRGLHTQKAPLCSQTLCLVGTVWKSSLLCSMHCLYCSLLEISSVILNIQFPYWSLNKQRSTKRF